MAEARFSYAVSAGVFLLVVVADRITKSIASNLLLERKSVELISDFLYLSLVKNTGVAFGLYKGFSVFLSIIGFLGFLAMLVFFPEIFRAKLSSVFIGLILGGAFSNFFDRITAGYVIDFIDIRFFSVFNLADVAITIGVMLLLYEFLVERDGGSETGIN